MGTLVSLLKTLDTFQRGLSQVPALQKPQQLHSHHTIATMPMTQLYCFTTDLCRDIKLTKTPGMSRFGAENYGVFLE